MLEVALSIVVLVGAGLLVRTLLNLQAVNPGFDTSNLLLFGINPTMAGYKDEQMMHLYSDLQQRFAALPGVVSAAYSDEPLLSGGYSADEVHLDGAPPRTNVNPDFLSRQPPQPRRTPALLQLRPVPSHPSGHLLPFRSSSMMTFARQFFPHKNPVGMHMGNGDSDDPRVVLRPGYRIVGITGDTKYKDLKRFIRPTIYTPLVGSHAYFELRTAGDPMALVSAVHNIVATADSGLPVFDVRTQTQQIARTHFQERLLSRLSSFFAVLATALACIGLYGLLSYEVAKRTRELGIRMALGAQKRHLLKLVVRQGILLSLGGIGTGAAFAVTRFMAGMLYNVRPNDPGTFVAVSGLLLVVALAACSVPALRAVRVDPLVALRSE